MIAVDADPALCARLQQTFATSLSDGRLKIVNMGVGGETAVLPFYVNEFAEWSSFDAQSKATKRLSHSVINVQMEPLSKLIADHGVPYYLKIDIEGHELDALRTLSPGADMPTFLSFEVNIHWEAILTLLGGLGYDRFQLVRQEKGNLPPAPVPAKEGLSVSQRFSNAHSGCFGRDLADDWQPDAAFRAKTAALLAESHGQRLAGQRADWFDIHARLAGGSPGRALA